MIGPRIGLSRARLAAYVKVRQVAFSSRAGLHHRAHHLLHALGRIQGERSRKELRPRRRRQRRFHGHAIVGHSRREQGHRQGREQQFTLSNGKRRQFWRLDVIRHASSRGNQFNAIFIQQDDRIAQTHRLNGPPKSFSSQFDAQLREIDIG